MRQTNVREKLIAGGTKCFHSQGYKGTTIDDIAKASGVFKGSVYNHFKSKEALAIEVISQYERKGTATLKLKGPPSPLRRLKSHFDYLASLHKANDYQNGCLLGNFSSEAAHAGKYLRRALDDAYQRWFAAMETVIRQAQAEGEISTHYEPEQLARFLGNSWEGATNYLKVIRSRKPLDDFLDLTLSTNFLE
jgi:TetR/AcrR family transcriptional repressor of nem operon